MKRIIAILTAAIVFAIPAVASAHSGTVVCNSNGVVFTYNANFPVTENAFEKVVDSSGNIQTVNFMVIAGQVTSNTIPGFTGTVTASSTWVGGGEIPPTVLTCPAVPTPIPAPVPVTPQPIPAPLPPATIPPIHITIPKCPKGTKRYGIFGGVLICTKRHVVVKIKIKLIRYTPVGPPKPRPGGVTG